MRSVGHSGSSKKDAVDDSRRDHLTLKKKAAGSSKGLEEAIWADNSRNHWEIKRGTGSSKKSDVGLAFDDGSRERCSSEEGYDALRSIMALVGDTRKL